MVLTQLHLGKQDNWNKHPVHVLLLLIITWCSNIWAISFELYVVSHMNDHTVTYNVKIDPSIRRNKLHLAAPVMYVCPWVLCNLACIASVMRCHIWACAVGASGNGGQEEELHSGPVAFLLLSGSFSHTQTDTGMAGERQRGRERRNEEK